MPYIQLDFTTYLLRTVVIMQIAQKFGVQVTKGNLYLFSILNNLFAHHTFQLK